MLDNSLSPALVASRNDGLALLSKLLLVVSTTKAPINCKWPASSNSARPTGSPSNQQLQQQQQSGSAARAGASTEEMSASSFSPAGPAEINSRRRAVANCPASSSSVGSWSTKRPCPKYSTSLSDESSAEDDLVVQQPSAGPIGKHLELPASSCLLDSLRTSRFHQLSEASQCPSTAQWLSLSWWP